jgi:hypothetical protein
MMQISNKARTPKRESGPLVGGAVWFSLLSKEPCFGHFGRESRHQSASFFGFGAGRKSAANSASVYQGNGPFG